MGVEPTTFMYSHSAVGYVSLVKMIDEVLNQSVYGALSVELRRDTQ